MYNNRKFLPLKWHLEGSCLRTEGIDTYILNSYKGTFAYYEIEISPENKEVYLSGGFFNEFSEWKCSSVIKAIERATEHCESEVLQVINNQYYKWEGIEDAQWCFDEDETVEPIMAHYSFDNYDLRAPDIRETKGNVNGKYHVGRDWGAHSYEEAQQLAEKWAKKVFLNYFYEFD